MSEEEIRKAEARRRAEKDVEKGVFEPPSYEFNPEGHIEYVGTHRAETKRKGK